MLLSDPTRRQEQKVSKRPSFEFDALRLGLQSVYTEAPLASVSTPPSFASLAYVGIKKTRGYWVFILWVVFPLFGCHGSGTTEFLAVPRRIFYFHDITCLCLVGVISDFNAFLFLYSCSN